eukprot:303964-Prymnesium_polylepis.1
MSPGSTPGCASRRIRSRVAICIWRRSVDESTCTAEASRPLEVLAWPSTVTREKCVALASVKRSATSALSKRCLRASAGYLPGLAAMTCHR